MSRFDLLWDLFENRKSQFGGTYFRIFPFQPFFSKKFFDTNNEVDARLGLHRAMAEWGRIEQKQVRLGRQKYFRVTPRERIPIPRTVDPEHAWSMHMIFFAYYNLCSLAMHGKTIEELILEVRAHRGTLIATKSVNTAVRRLVSLSNSFLLAEWMQELIWKAVSNDDNELLGTIANAITKDSIGARYSTARQWLATLMLWYLGGSKIRPRHGLLKILKDKKILGDNTAPQPFYAMLFKLGLTRSETLTKIDTDSTKEV